MFAAVNMLVGVTKAALTPGTVAATSKERKRSQEKFMFEVLHAYNAKI